MLQTRSQRFADSAYKKVLEVSKDKDKRDEYKRVVLNLPVLIRTAGLAQALAFVEKEHTKLIQHLAETVEVTNLSASSRSVSLQEYMRITRDTLDALVWYKRFAESLIKT
ncbi:MAG: type III-B CRISPR module-associated protein Cmr5 [Acidobacteria bacterium]|nr:type III-B CRISPR module-associated protein Cmr5 [Acidobacteriota bacterium]